jgi:hypothetical protein
VDFVTPTLKKRFFEMILLDKCSFLAKIVAIHKAKPPMKASQGSKDLAEKTMGSAFGGTRHQHVKYPVQENEKIK